MVSPYTSLKMKDSDHPNYLKQDKLHYKTFEIIVNFKHIYNGEILLEI